MQNYPLFVHIQKPDFSQKSGFFKFWNPVSGEEFKKCCTDFQIITNFKIWHKASGLKAYNNTPVPWKRNEIICLEVYIKFQDVFLSDASTRSKPIRGVSNIEPKKYPQNPIFLFLPNNPIIKLDIIIIIASISIMQNTFL